MRRSIIIGVWAAPLVIAMGPMAGVSAVTVEVAKACQILTEKGISSPPNWKSCGGQRKGNGERLTCLFQQMCRERWKSG
jgi:hypothetical protein